MAIPSVNQFANNPGGGLVTALGGINALRNSYYDANYNRIKSQLAPTTLGAEAASKLAYAQMMGPQYLAKVFKDPRFIAGLSEEQRSALPGFLLNHGMGQTGGNSLNQMPRMPGNSQQPQNSLLDSLKNSIQNIFGRGQNQSENSINMGAGEQISEMGQPQAQGMNLQGGESQTDNAEGMQSQSPEDEALSAWRATPEAQIDMPPGPNGLPDQKKLDYWYYGPAGRPMEMTLNKGQRAPETEQLEQQQEKSLAQKTGEMLGTEEQGKAAGKFRAEAKRDIGKAQLALSGSGAALNNITKIVKDPIWQNARKLPAFQKQQLSVLKVTGTDAEKKLIGKFEAAAESLIAATVQGMGSRHLVREYDLAQRQKINDSDTIPSSEGKLQNAIELHDIAEQKNDIISNLLSQGVDEADAVKIANKKVDVSEIERRTEKLLQNKISEDDINETMKANKMTREQVIERLKKEGRYNG